MMLVRLLKKQNQGFTLVEIIITVAIVSILTAMLTPNYIQYIEKSRIGVDEAYIREVAHSLEIVAATDSLVNTAPITVEFDNEGKIQGCTASGPKAAAAKAIVDAELLEFFPVSQQRFESGYYKGTAAESSSGVTLVLNSQGIVSISGTKNINS